MSDDLAWLDATAQADLVRRGELTPLELVEAAIDRIERLNPALNAVITPLYDKARAAATSAALPDGPFRGVPFLVKDAVAHTAGDPYHCGMGVLKEAGWREPDDTWLVARYRAAGLVICGKTNLPEMATSATTQPAAYGATHNPWDTTRTPGGSSGGSAAAVASGMVALAHGNDMGGSIRIPSAHCGLVGLKPTRARSTLGPDFGEYWGPTTHEHVLTRSVRDTAALLDATAGMAPGDPYTAPPPPRPYAQEVGADPGRLRIGVRTRRRTGGPSDPECAAAVEETARVLESLGHVVNPAAMDALDQPGAEGFFAVFAAAIARDVERWGDKLGRPIQLDELEPSNAALTERGRAISATEYIAAFEIMNGYSRRVGAWWADGNDVLVLPTCPRPPATLAELDPAGGEVALGRMAEFAEFTTPFNITGQPAMSVPMHWTASGLPVGVQLVAAYGREDVLIRLASQLEAAVPWNWRRPPAPPDA
ncbi:MAG TPA: amidase [Acidimicrobiales bacterium]|jgi:amidase